MEPSGQLIEQVASRIGRNMAERWWDLGDRTVRAAMGADPTEVNGELDSAAGEEPESPIGPGLRLWRSDALARAGRYHDAAASFDDVISVADGVPTLGDVDVVGEALRRRAAVLAQAGDVDAAIEAFRDAADRTDLTLLYRAGVVAERAGRFDQAAELYGQIAADRRSPDADDRAQRALRARERLTDQSGVFRPSLAAISSLVEAALTGRDAALLRQLASSTHFWAGPGGGHFQYETLEVIDWLCEDLGRSRPRRMTRGLLGTGRKRYLLTSGWRGRYFRGIVGFAFAESGRGWQWTGLVITGPADPWRSRWEPKEKMSNQALPFGLLAPWPEGRRFTAGGLPGFVARSAAIAAAAFIPFAGPAIAAALALGFSLENCGFGLRGFYYNEGPTHQGRDAFAIDFTTYRRGVPFANQAGGTPVLCSADGIVRFVDDDVASGDDSDANEVQVDHVDPATGSNRFVSRYMHMTGPFAIPVSAGMPAPVGRRLGIMNDTGTSVLDHLHFSIHDSTSGTGIGNSVRPTPMEGVTLDDGASGTCIRSTNRETIVVVLPPGCRDALRDIIRRAFGRG